MAELSEVHGRAWDDVDVSNNPPYTRYPDSLTFRGLSSIDLVARGYCTQFYIVCSVCGGATPYGLTGTIHSCTPLEERIKIPG